MQENWTVYRLSLANCYAGRFYLLYESELSLTFGTDLVAGKRSDRGSALRLGNSERFLGSSAKVDRILQPGRISDQSGGRRRLVEGATVWLPTNRAEICECSKWMSCALGPFGPGFRWRFGENSMRYFRLLMAL